MIKILADFFDNYIITEQIIPKSVFEKEVLHYGKQV